ncbi:MAG: DUF433 domain-containing protein [Candidatus Lokiarchaeota archaeon]|nr:DUF433 domain-containing protein [Candidatus Lokiarchaeota archaeon]MBD3202382.1 DUF433 domain-containing protein [Candidatus Lokiarchaeota archaeon]
MSWKDFISFDPKVCHGKAHIKGTRVLISVILDSLAEKISIDELLEEYPSLKEDDIYAALQYGAKLAREDIITIKPQKG